MRGLISFDTAEMYPVNPLTAETQGDSEEIVGNWLQARGKRDQVVDGHQTFWCWHRTYS